MCDGSFSLGTIMRRIAKFEVKYDIMHALSKSMPMSAECFGNVLASESTI